MIDFIQISIFNESDVKSFFAREIFIALSFRTKVNFSFMIAFVFVFVISLYSYKSTDLLLDNSRSVAHAHQVLGSIEEVLSEMKDLETGQRGFSLTGDETYLEPYNKALVRIEPTIQNLSQLTIDNERQQHRIAKMKELQERKTAELKNIILIRKNQGLAAATKAISTGSGKNLMDQLRYLAEEMKNEENRLIEVRNRRTQESTQATRSIIVMGCLLSMMILLGALVLINQGENERSRAAQKIEQRDWLRAGWMELGEKIAGEQTLTALAQHIIESVAAQVKASVGSIYFVDEEKVLNWAGGYAFASSAQKLERFQFGEGLIGQAALQKKTLSLADAPENYFKVTSSLGYALPKYIHVLPLVLDDDVKGVIELGSFSQLTSNELEFLNFAAERVAVAINSAQTRLRTEQLLQTTQAQSEELQAQQEELRASNEELEEKTQELEAQQEELRQINEELEQQRMGLAQQAEKLEKSHLEIEAASRYKSEFLANMSHELRTPLNSILLLSKSLAENQERNLTAEQHEICQTVYSSGVDLLSLIDDILDLSKVEAGKLDVAFQPADLVEIATSMENLFKLQMKEKNLKFHVEVSSDLPKSIYSDRLRIEQVIKNFLSNSLKFTEKGQVSLNFRRPDKGTVFLNPSLRIDRCIAISVMDSGVGIPELKQTKIFEAFEQVDRTSSRKFGGAGLGLTIATKISQLLGAEIQMESQLQQGSRFTLYLPENIESQKSDGAGSVKSQAHSTLSIQDDRGQMTNKARSLQIIATDPAIWQQLLNLGRKKDFLCLISTDAEAALLDADAFRPSAIILDLDLAGVSGMTVLERLKGSAKTRHIPVHVLSRSDRASDVRKMGAIGFLSKPAGPNDISFALDRIEEIILTKARKVLLVEDRKVERESIKRLIGNNEIKTTEVESGQQALEQLKSNAFDCMILDLKLTDMSGFDLLDQMEKNEALSRPPVIVYTAKDLTQEEILRLGKFSDSIIIKGARSEERLLDEVTLFLHRVESELPLEKQKILEKLRHREEIFEKKKLLIVDDDMRNVFALRNLFMKKGFEVFVAKTGREALENLDSQPTMDVVLMDIMMPEMDGYEAIKRIRAQSRFDDLPIIALTAKAMSADREKSIEAGANDYLAKPINIDQLLSLLRIWLSH